MHFYESQMVLGQNFVLSGKLDSNFPHVIIMLLISLDVQTLFKCLAIAFSTMTLFTGITPLYGNSFRYAGPVGLVWGWVVVTFFTWFMGFAMAEICSSFPVSSLHLPVLIIIIINIIFHLFLDFFCSERLDLFLDH